MLRAMRRELETELRILLLGHEGGNPGDGQGDSYGLPRQLSTLPVVRSLQYDLDSVGAQTYTSAFKDPVQKATSQEPTNVHIRRL